MPRNETIINVFVASPSDVSEERKALESIVNELNKTWSNKLGLRLDLVKWETDVYPGFGNYSQDVINNQINDEYDIFIAIFWSRLGTPTRQSKSGSLEELERAYAKYKQTKDEVDIMVYFKDQAIPPSKMDFEQLQNIQKLKEQLGEKGGLYWTFDETEDFETLLRIHLSKVAQKWATKTSSERVFDIKDQEQTVLDSSDKSDDNEEDEFEDYGLLDYIDIHEDRMSEMTGSLVIIAEANNRIGHQFAKRTQEIAEVGDSDKSKVRKIINLTGNDLDRFAEILNSQIDIYSKSREEGFYALSMALSVYVDFLDKKEPDKQLLELEESLENMKQVTKETIKGLTGFRTSLDNLPRLTVNVNRSKKFAVKALDRVLEEVETTNQSATDVLQSVRELINNIKT